MSRPDEPLHTLTGTVARETDRAILFQAETIDGNPWDDEVSSIQWYPISQVGSKQTAPDGQVTLKVKRWILQQKGIV